MEEPFYTRLLSFCFNLNSKFQLWQLVWLYNPDNHRIIHTPLALRCLFMPPHNPPHKSFIWCHIWIHRLPLMVPLCKRCHATSQNTPSDGSWLKSHVQPILVACQTTSVFCLGPCVQVNPPMQVNLHMHASPSLHVNTSRMHQCVSTHNVMPMIMPCLCA